LSRDLSRISLRQFFASLFNRAGSQREIELDQYRIRFFHWQADENGFKEWRLEGVEPGLQGSLKLSPEAEKGEDGVLSGEMISPVLETGFELHSAIASWNVDSPPGSWVKISLRVQFEGIWSRWYILGIWSQSGDPDERHSVNGQDDERIKIATDTLVVREGLNSHALQMKINLNSRSDSQYPVVTAAALVADNRFRSNYIPTKGNRQLWNKIIEVPQFSQMVYPDGGNVWCSPTSVSMLLAYWQNYKGLPEPLVRETVAGVYDAIYEGAGNWSFNTAYAATRGMNSAVSRLASLEEAEEFIARGIPLAMSLSWKPGELTGAPVEKSNGHLVVLAGFDALGNPVVNDPAAKEDSLVRRVYQRQEFEKLWRTTSGGVVYIITPPGITWPE
jgi:hypothetical protein